MSYVLILNSDFVGKPPAVIGGYTNVDDAVRAGDLATAFSADNPNEAMPYYSSYVVIPGAAVLGPLRAKHCTLERNDDGFIVRHTRHIVEPAEIADAYAVAAVE